MREISAGRDDFQLVTGRQAIFAALRLGVRIGIGPSFGLGHGRARFLYGQSL